MSLESHVGQILPLSSQVIPISSNTTFYASYDHDFAGFNQGEQVNPYGENDALHFNGSTTEVPMPWIDINNKTEFSFSGWIYPQSVKKDQMFVGWGSLYTNYLRILNGRVGFSLHTTKQDYATGKVTIVDNRWYHVAATYDGVTMRTYIDGIPDIAYAKSGSVTASGPTSLGIWIPYDRRPYTGKMNNVSFWDKCLTAEEVKYFQFNGPKGDEPYLLGFWKMNEASGSVLRDTSVIGNDALVTSGSWGSGEMIASIQPGRYGGAVAVESSTENLHDATFSRGDGMTIPANASIKDITVPGLTWAKEYTATAVNTQNTFNRVRIVTPPGTYTFSVSIRLIKGTLTNNSIQLYLKDNATTSSTSVLVGDKVTQQWQRFYVTFTMDSAATTIERASVLLSSDTVATIQIADWQLEQKSFPTSFTPSIREYGRLGYTPTAVNQFEGSVSMWVKSLEATTDVRHYFYYGNSDGFGGIAVNEIEFGIGQSSGLIKAYYYSNNGTQTGTVIGSVPVPLDTWTHIVMTWKHGEKIKLYINGQLNEEKAAPLCPPNPANTEYAFIGCCASKNFRAADALIDDVRIEKTQLSEEEIMMIYHGSNHYNYLDYSGAGY